MAETPKRIKRLLREYAAVAHEEELRRALLPVAEAFRRWEGKELDSGELSEIIHKFHKYDERNSTPALPVTPSVFWLFTA